MSAGIGPKQQTAQTELLVVGRKGLKTSGRERQMRQKGLDPSSEKLGTLAARKLAIPMDPIKAKNFVETIQFLHRIAEGQILWNQARVAQSLHKFAQINF